MSLVHILIICALVLLFSLIILGAAVLVKKHPGILLGSYQLLQSPSGVFGLLTLLAITIVTLHQPSVGGTAFAAFVTIVPAILSWTEHKETMAQMVIQNNYSNPQSNELPSKGTI